MDKIVICVIICAFLKHCFALKNKQTLLCLSELHLTCPQTARGGHQALWATGKRSSTVHSPGKTK